MAVLSRTTENSLTIYRDTISSFALACFLATCIMVFGLMFLFFASEKTLFKVLGVLFTAISSFILLYLPSYYRKLQLQGGQIIFTANHDGVKFYVGANEIADEYNWPSIKKIVFASKMEVNDSDGWEYSENQVIFYLNCDPSIFERMNNNISLSPSNKNVCIVCSPSNNIQGLCGDMLYLSSNSVDIKNYEKVRFDFKRGLENTEGLMS